MTEEQQLKLQSFLDGELTEREAGEVAAWVAKEPESADLLRELRNTRRALARFEETLKVPESREFYWARIEREIRKLEEAPRAGAEPLRVRLRRFLAPAGAFAALVLIAALAIVQSNLFPLSRGPDTEMTLADSGTFTYQDYQSGTTLVWLSFPAETEFAKSPPR